MMMVPLPGIKYVKGYKNAYAVPLVYFRKKNVGGGRKVCVGRP